MAERRSLPVFAENADGNSEDKESADFASYEFVTSTNDCNIETYETIVRNILRKASLDDEVWAVRIQEGFTINSIDELRNISDEQIQAFLKTLESSDQEILREVFAKIVAIAKSKVAENVGQGESSTAQSQSASDQRPTDPNIRPSEEMFSFHAQLTDGGNFSAARVVRSVQNGALCRGVYFSRDIRQVVQNRDLVVDVGNDVVECKLASLPTEILHAEFTSKEAMYSFVTHIDKYMYCRPGSSRVATRANDQGNETNSQDKYVSSVHYQLFPVVLVNLPIEKIQLRPEVIAALQEIEQSLVASNYESGDHFMHFFEKYGTHISDEGTFGGTLMSIAQIEEFQEEDKSKIAAVVAEASKTALHQAISSNVSVQESSKVYKDFGETIGVRSEALQNIRVAVKKIGGHEDTEDVREWEKNLGEDNSLWRLIKRSAYPRPIWKILPRHEQPFKDQARLGEAMKAEWNRSCGREAKVSERRSLEEIPQSGKEEQTTEARKGKEEEEICLLRQQIQLWIEGYMVLDIQNVELSIRTLADMRSQYNKIDKHWLHEVLYLRDVQKILFSAVKYIKQIGDGERKGRLVSLLKRIMHPAEKIQESYFPKIRQILVVSQDSTTLLPMNQYRFTDMRQLPNVWKNFKTGRNLTEKEGDVPVEDLQCALESAMESLSKHQKSYEFLLGVATLRLFDFSLANFQFEYQLLKRDLDAICQLFETHLRNLDSIENLRRKQAYILRLSLYNRRSGEATAQYLIKEMPLGICEELKDVYDSRGSVNSTALERKVSEMLPHFQFDIKSFMHSFQSQLSFLQRGYQIDARRRDSSKVADGEHLTDALRKLLKDLGMTKYYPEKLTFEDITTLTSDVHEDVNKKPTSLPELPWYFIKHVIGLDSDTREECHVMGNSQNSSHDGNDSSSDEDDDNTLGIHPLDLIYILFICADDFLRQELGDKMVRCQYAIPFMFPSSTSKMMILHWALRSITRSFYHQGQDATKTLVDVEAPLVTFMNIGEETSWKSRLLNKMLSSQQETFWHQELRGGNRKQCVSHGMVEVAWYLPGRQGDNKFQWPVTFLNMRNNLDRSETVCNRLLNSSSLSCLFVDDIDDSLTQFLLRRNSLEKLLLVVLHTKDKRQKIKEKSANLLGMFQLKESQIIRRTAEGANFNSVYEKIKNSIEIAIEESKQVPSLSTVILDAIENENMETDDRKCYHGHMAAQSILRDIDQLNKGGNAKEEVLPCQSDLETRRKMAELDKELCRQRKIKEDMTVVSWGYHIKSEKWKLQLIQLQKPISDTFKYFLQCLCNLEATDRKYFLQCLKLGLNERSVDLLQPLYDKYERYRSEVESEERDMNLQILDSQLMYGSLGVEHFFREMAILYENISTLQENAGFRSESLNTLLNTLSGTMASLLMDGTAVEIMDGDAVNVPVEWLKAVLKGVENSTKSTLFKVSAIGAQGSGKSTLLNTTFGLNFPVSSGRCTRGAYMQLLKVDGQLKKTLKCDYVAVIDSEGLMSRAKLGDCDYDNELSTLIIGLSDLTLVVFKDEGIEMQHVLPLAILVFLRMNLVGEHQGCHFVYEKRGAIGTLAKQDLEIDAFVRDLNKETLAAAKKVDQSDQYTKFTDVLQYDSTKDNTYIPSLYDGTEMGKTNPQHMKMTQRLKFSVVSHIEDLHSKAQKKPFKPYTFTEVASRLEDLWGAIKFENFVLGFKNVLAVEAHGELTKIFNKKQWAIKRAIRDMILEENNIIENEILHGQSSQPVAHLTDASRNKLSAEIHDRTSELEKEVGHYFQCGGCEKCDATVANRKLLANNEKEFADEVAALRRTLVREVDMAFENLEFRMKADKAIHDLNRDMDETISKKVNEAITAQKGEQLPKEQVEDIFEALWKEVTGDILRHAPRANRNESIKAAVQNTLRRQLGTSEWQFYLQRESRRKNKPKQHRRKTLGDDSASGFAAGDGKHLKLQGWYSKLTSSVNEQDLHRLQTESDRILEETSKYYDPRLSPEGRKFSQSAAEELFRDVIGRIENINDEKVKITNDYKVDLLHFIEERAVSGFTDMHIKYCDESSPEALLEQKKKAYHGLFVVQMGQGDAVLTFCNTAVKAIILSNLDEDLSCTELLDALKQSQEETLKDIKSIQASIMADLMEENKFEKFISYITTYETYVKHTMKVESTHYFTEEDRLKNLAKSKLDNILAVLKEAVQETALDISQDDTDAGSFINTFLAKIKALKIPRNEIAAFLEMRNVPGKKQFAEIVEKQLEETLKSDVTQVIDSWDVSEKLEAKEFDEFLFKEIVRCDARCPFCKVPCDVHSGGKREGNHSATLHRPQGLGGFCYKDTENLVTNDCCSDVGSNSTFTREKGKNTYYKKYREVYPDWYIQGDADPDSEKYWKWVLANHNKEFAEYYSAKPADIPQQWANYTVEEVTKDIVTNYAKMADRDKPGGILESLFRGASKYSQRFSKYFCYLFYSPSVATDKTQAEEKDESLVNAIIQYLPNDIPAPFAPFQHKS